VYGLGFKINCIIWGNTNNDLTDPAYNCCIQGWTGSSSWGNITSDPQFVNAAAGDFHLKPTSPCIDAGRIFDKLYTDLEGNPRGITGYAEARGDGSHFDIGAYEYWLPAPVITPATGVYASPLTVKMTGPAGATIRYTLDGSDPKATSPAYTAPLTLKGTAGKKVTVTARSFTAGLTPSNIDIRYYTFR
jgi:hypothetical protein